MKFSYFQILIILYLISCQPNQDTVSFDELPVFAPSIIQEFDSLGEDIFFSHLAYTTLLFDDETIFLPDRDLGKIFKITSDGNLISTIASKGRGPGEVQDISFVSRSFDNTILVYDQENKKVLRFSPSGKYLEEFMLEPWDKGILSEIYELDEDHLLMVYRSFDYLLNSDLDPEAYLVIFDKNTQQYIRSKTISDRLFARNIINNQPRGGQKVPYSPEHLYYFNHRNSKFYSFSTEDETIASLTSSLDTAQTVTFNLSRELLSKEEINTIREDLPNSLWRNMEPLLPEYKAIADDLIIDDNNNFWLKLNYRSQFQQWLVLSESGKELAIVQLPKDGILTHVSKQHLGFRLDDHKFALFEPINW